MDAHYSIITLSQFRIQWVHAKSFKIYTLPEMIVLSTHYLFVTKMAETVFSRTTEQHKTNY